MVQPRLMSNAFLIKPTVMNFSSAAETPASHMHRTTTLDNRIQTFFNQQSGKELNLKGLTEFMDESFLQNHMSYVEYEEYHPIIDEIVFYVIEWYNNAEVK